MDLKQLKTFIVVSETGSLSAAAARLHLAQPALSRHIKMLEAEIGVELFVRHGRGMEPTDAGAEFLGRVGGLVAQLEKSVEDMHGAAEPSGHVTLGLFPSVIRLLGFRILRRVTEDLPRVSLRIIEAFSTQLSDRLERGEVDIAVLGDPNSDSRMRITELLSEEYFVLGSRDSDLVPGVPLSAEALARLPLLIPGPIGRRGNVIVAMAELAKVKLHLPYEVDSMVLTMSMVEQGLGYTVLPMSAVREEVTSGRFRAAPLGRPALRRQVALALPSSRADTRATSAVVQTIFREVADMIRTGTWDAVPGEAVRAAMASLAQPE